MKKIKDFKKKINQNSIVLLCVIRDEELVLEAFISHYKSLLVSHFIFIDNGSKDHTLSIINQNKLEITYQLWSADERYSENLYGLKWVNFILNSELKGKWCLVVDADEFLLLDGIKNLRELRKDMRKSNSNILSTCLIDFYPRNNTEPYKRGNPPFSHSEYYDKFTYFFVDRRQEKGDIELFYGGLRRRIYGADKSPFLLSKKSFFKNIFYDSHYLAPGMHFFKPNQQDIKTASATRSTSKGPVKFYFYQKTQLLAHFKYLRPNLLEYFKTRVKRNEDWNNSRSYKQYAANNSASFFDRRVSSRFISINKLYHDTLYKKLSLLESLFLKLSTGMSQLCRRLKKVKKL